MAIVDPKDSVFANAADAVSDFETIFDDEDSIIEMVEGLGENGESLIGRDPEIEITTESDSEVVKDVEDSSPSTDFDIEPDAETGKGVIESGIDLDDLFGVNENEEQTDKTDKSDITKEPVETETKDFHNEACGDKSGAGSGCSDSKDKKEEKVSEAEEQTDKTNKSNVLEEPVETDKKEFHDGDVRVDNVKESVDLDELFGVNEAEEQTDKTNKSNMLEEPVETEEKDFHNEGCSSKSCSGSGSDVKDPEEDTDPKYDISESQEEQTDKTDKSDMTKEPVETEIKDFHNESVDLDVLFNSLEECGDPISNASLCPVCGGSPCKCKGGAPKQPKQEEQTDKTVKSDMLEEPVETEEKDFHNESVDLDDLFGIFEQQEEQTDKTNKSDILEEPIETVDKDFHNEGAELDALFEALEDEQKHDEFDDSEEGIEKKVSEASDDIDYSEDELIDAAEKEDGGTNVKLDYQPGEDDAIIDKVMSNKNI